MERGHRCISDWCDRHDGLGSGLRFCVDGRHGVSYPPPSSPCGMSPRNIEFDEFYLFEKLSQALAALAFLLCCTLHMFSPVHPCFGSLNQSFMVLVTRILTPPEALLFIMLHGWWGLGRVGQ
jgi:hypothetical protein